jgi:hypothetical protein
MESTALGWVTGACAGLRDDTIEMLMVYLCFCCSLFISILFNSACRMMSGPVFLLPPLKHIDRFFVRLDADSHITRPVTKRTDALDAAAQGGQVYVFWSVALETCR